MLLFGRDAFLAAHHGQTLHALVRDQGKHWEAGVAADLSRIVFDELYPSLVKAIAAHDPNRDAGLSTEYLSEVRQGASTFLYRLLFVLYAEDRHLLPVERDAYKEFALTRLRDEIAKKFADHSGFSDRSTLYWSRLETIFRAIGEGDDTLGIPPYNGGLFQQAEAPILARAGCPTMWWRISFFRCRTKRRSRNRSTSTIAICPCSNSARFMSGCSSLTWSPKARPLVFG